MAKLVVERAGWPSIQRWVRDNYQRDDVTIAGDLLDDLGNRVCLVIYSNSDVVTLMKEDKEKTAAAQQRLDTAEMLGWL